MHDNMLPMNGNYIDSTGQIRNLDGTFIGDAPPCFSQTMHPFNGDFIASDGQVRNIDSLGVGGSSPEPPSTTTTIETVLNASSWSGNTLSLANSEIQANGNGIILPSQDATSAQYDALCAAKPHVTSQADGLLTIVAHGTKPTVNIPVTILLFS